MKIHIIIFVFFIFSFSLKSENRLVDDKTFMCADQKGPRFEFIIPEVNDNLENEKFSFKYFDIDDRNSFKIEHGRIKKTSSYIDDSYYFYKVTSDSNKDDRETIYFEFFPPSTMMLKVNNLNFLNLACWKKK